LLLTPACALSIVPYAVLLYRSDIPLEYHGLWLFPGAIVALALGELLDARRGRWRDFPWDAPSCWIAAAGERFLSWWALPLYALGYGLATAAPLFTQLQADVTALACLLLMGVYGWALYRFRRRLWLLAVALVGQLAAAFTLQIWEWWRWPAWAWLRFLPVTLLTLGMGLYLERRLREGSPWHTRRLLRGWSRPLYALAFANLLISQVWGWGDTQAAAALTLANALILMLLAAFWEKGFFTYIAAALGLISLRHWFAAQSRTLPETIFPQATALLALGYGAIGYSLALAARRRRWHAPDWVSVFMRPLQHTALVIATLIVPLFAFNTFIYMVIIPSVFSEAQVRATSLDVTWMFVHIFSRLGLLYLFAAVTYRRPRMGYGALGMLVLSWATFVFYVQRWAGPENLQWYALPVGLYLILVGYVEAWEGRRKLARWIDYAALLLLLGSLFWQTLVYGWRFALLLGAEGLVLLWFGSARRLRRFFYAGMVGVMLAVVGQLINALQSVNQWIVFGIIGLLLVSIAALVERKMEQIKISLEEVFEDWE